MVCDRCYLWHIVVWVKFIIEVIVARFHTIILGDIVGVTGLEKTITGDTLLSKANAVQKYEEARITLPPLALPDPVFMCSVEPFSTRDQKKLDEALRLLVKEDPSLRLAKCLNV